MVASRDGSGWQPIWEGEKGARVGGLVAGDGSGRQSLSPRSSMTMAGEFGSNHTSQCRAHGCLSLSNTSTISYIVVADGTLESVRAEAGSSGAFKSCDEITLRQRPPPLLDCLPLPGQLQAPLISSSGNTSTYSNTAPIQHAVDDCASPDLCGPDLRYIRVVLFSFSRASGQDGQVLASLAATGDRVTESNGGLATWSVVWARIGCIWDPYPCTQPRLVARR